ncbi:hypothetical protein, partial [Aeromonas cavernicola]|uniref:hypothetical protein n=1 Tax=Aeromonas cavernicola TaxID=1006623 RepID=UPI0012FDD9C1
ASLPVIVALSGPAISTATVTSRSPALDIWLLDLSGSMAAHDLAPDRATRVRVQLQQWLATPADHRIALILYAADAYLAMPATADHRALALLLPDLRPSIMPSPRLSSARFGQQGQPPSGSSDAPERAIALALAQIPEGEQARLLLITDDLDGVQRAKIEAQLAAASPCQWRLFCPQPARVRLDILLANSGKAATMPPHPASDNSVNRLARLPIPNSEEMTTLAQRFGGQLQWLSTTPPRFAPLPTTSRLATAHVQELGPWLLIPLLALALRARAGHLWLLLLALTGGALHSPATQASAAQQITQATVDVSQEAHAMAAYQRGAFRWAAQHFSQPIWQGNAWYRAGDYRQAVAAYQQDQSATAHYNRGNALVQLGELAAAEEAYLAALAATAISCSGHRDDQAAGQGPPDKPP